MRPLGALSALIFILSVLAAGSVQAVNTCPSLFAPHGSTGVRTRQPVVDSRYGRANQTDARLAAAGLIGSKGSMLCGPTCAVNVLEKFRAVEGRKTPAADAGADQVIDLAKRLFSRTSPHLLEKGSRIDEVARVLQTTINEEKLPGTVDGYSAVESIPGFKRTLSAQAFRDSAHDDTMVIAQIGYYTEPDLKRIGPANRKFAHFMIVAGYNAENPSEFYFIDPVAPEKLRLAHLRSFNTDAFENQVIHASFEDGRDRQPTVIVEGLIVVKRTHAPR